MNYTLLHLHTDYSNGITNIDSVTKYSDYIRAAKDLKMSALAFTEHGTCFDWTLKKREVEEAGLKYIHGCEFYITKNIEKKNLIRDNFHCVLLAKNYDGVLEINALISKSFNKEDGHFYYRPRISFAELKATSDNIIVLTACIGGILYGGDNDIRKDFAKWLSENKHRCFLEIAHHKSSKQIEYNKFLYKISQKYDIRLVAGTDTHCLNDEHKFTREQMQKSKGVHFDNEDEFDLILRTYDELLNAFKTQNALPYEAYKTALDNTNAVANMVEKFTLDKTAKYPQLFKNPKQLMDKLIRQGLEWRKIGNDKKYINRVKDELKTFVHNDALNFMLLENDYKTQMRKKGIMFGYSRGSCSGSLVAYLLGITDIDPIKWNMNFERFMNRERISLADIDTDWYKKDVPTVKDYLYDINTIYKCEIVTFNRTGVREAFKILSRAYNIEPSLANKISSDLDNEEMYAVYEKQYPSIFKYMDICKGVIYAIGSHPAATVLSPISLNNTLGLIKMPTNKYPISQINMKEIDSLNFVKLDILGLYAVGVIYRTCDAAKIKRITPDNINFEDNDVWDSIKNDNTCIFQFESKSTGEYLSKVLSDEVFSKIKKISPSMTKLYLMAIASGAVRPGGASYRNELSNGVWHDNKHEALNEFFAPTLGYMVFQEQVINFLNQFCGYTMGEADGVRRNFAKKIGTEKDIPKIKQGFITTMGRKYNTSKADAESIIEELLVIIQDASDYLFSDNHAVPYSMTGYIIGWLRHYYPVEFIATALDIYDGDTNKINEVIRYALSNDIEIITPKYGSKQSKIHTFDKEGRKIYKPLTSIKSIKNWTPQCINLVIDKKLDNFVDILFAIKNTYIEQHKNGKILKKRIDKGNLEIMIDIGFFDMYGGAKYLKQIIKMFEKYSSCKTVKKINISNDKLRNIIEGCSEKSTDKQFNGIDNHRLVHELVKHIKPQHDLIQDKISKQIKYLGYTNETTKDSPHNYFVVLDNSSDMWGRTWLKIYQIQNGITSTFLLDKAWAKKHTCKVGDLIRCGIETKEKLKLVRTEENGKKIFEPDGYRNIIKNFVLIVANQ